MEITIKFNENDIKNYTSGIVEMLLQITDVVYKQKLEQSQSEQKQTKQEEKQEKTKSEQEKINSEQQKTPQYEVVELQKAASQKAKQIENGVEKVKALIKKYGTEKIPDMDKTHYAAFLRDLEALK